MSEVGKQIIQGLEEAVTLKQITVIFKGTPLDRLRAIAEAERDGRVVVLPCKADTLRRSIDVNVSEEVCLVEAEGLSRYGNCHLTCFECYVNALAKMEAEAALAAGKGE